MKLTVIANDGLKILTVFLPFLLLSSCGYRYTPGGEDIGRYVKNVYVAVFANNTSEAHIETVCRNAFINQFIKGRRFKVVNREEDADTLLKGNIKHLLISPLAYRGDNQAVAKRITIELSLILEDKHTNKFIWQENNFSQWEDYAIEENSILAGQNNQKNAFIKLANDVAERAYRMMVADF